MPVEFIYGEDRLTAVLKGDIDHHSAAEMRVMIDGELERTMPKLLLLDFAEVGFMDSSGIGFIMGRYKKIAPYRGKIFVVNLGRNLERIFRISGLYTITAVKDSVEKALSEVRGGKQ